MDILQQLHLSPAAAGIIVVALCTLCLILPILTSGIHFITSIVSAFTGLIGSVLHVASGGPVAWCGCLVAIGACGFIAMVVWFLANAPSSCAAHPTNFCSLLGFSH